MPFRKDRKIQQTSGVELLCLNIPLVGCYLAVIVALCLKMILYIIREFGEDCYIKSDLL